mmetsp:Transcript_48228/g.127682  ORF Transcript_48228/g.127682 Transcript_48228/m.127682 type:complete len:101 (-) Transcript_48228:59-361(-)
MITFLSAVSLLSEFQANTFHQDLIFTRAFPFCSYQTVSWQLRKEEEKTEWTILTGSMIQPFRQCNLCRMQNWLFTGEHTQVKTQTLSIMLTPNHTTPLIS